MNSNDAQKERTVPMTAIAAIRRNAAIVLVVSVLFGLALFAVGMYAIPKYEVTAYVEVGRLFYVNVDGETREEVSIPALVLAGQVNSGAYFRADGAPGELRTGFPRVSARVPVRTENVELRIRSDSASSAIDVLRTTVNRMGEEHFKMGQKPAIERLEARLQGLGAEVDKLKDARAKIEQAIVRASEARGGKDELQMLILASLRAQTGKDLQQAERVFLACSEAINQMKVRRTRIIGEPVVNRASLLPALIIGVFGLLAGAVVAATVIGFTAYRRAARGA